MQCDPHGASHCFFAAVLAGERSRLPVIFCLAHSVTIAYTSRSKRVEYCVMEKRLGRNVAECATLKRALVRSVTKCVQNLLGGTLGDENSARLISATTHARGLRVSGRPKLQFSGMPRFGVLGFSSYVLCPVVSVVLCSSGLSNVIESVV